MAKKKKSKKKKSQKEELKKRLKRKKKEEKKRKKTLRQAQGKKEKKGSKKKGAKNKEKQRKNKNSKKAKKKNKEDKKARGNEVNKVPSKSSSSDGERKTGRVKKTHGTTPKPTGEAVNLSESNIQHKPVETTRTTRATGTSAQELSTDFNAREAILRIRQMKSMEVINAFVKGDERRTVHYAVDIARRRIEART